MLSATYSLRCSERRVLSSLHRSADSIVQWCRWKDSYLMKHNGGGVGLDHGNHRYWQSWPLNAGDILNLKVNFTLQSGFRVTNVFTRRVFIFMKPGRYKMYSVCFVDADVLILISCVDIGFMDAKPFLISSENNLGPLLLTWFNLIPTWISNYIHYKVWDEITYPMPNFNDVTVQCGLKLLIYSQTSTVASLKFWNG